MGYFRLEPKEDEEDFEPEFDDDKSILNEDIGITKEQWLLCFPTMMFLRNKIRIVLLMYNREETTASEPFATENPS